MKTKILAIIAILCVLISCVSAKSTLKNVDENAPEPTLTSEGYFLLSKKTTDKKYGYHKDHPINVFYKNAKDEAININRFLDALTGPNGEKIAYKKLENCCPFPTTRTEMGAGLLDLYEISYPGISQPVQLYFNNYSKGHLYIPVGFSAK
ncbi:2-dehydro-3-deoxyphosphooctonate aldolase [Flavobacterium sp. NST-5]|uniref:2-dehydro-3-deoxyphosphooctonate aldolase n=1 Tax=Flavobacterium ichthyis TaxID=2698827 RepID=A0ABW9Z5J3_9FLAO|nr:2-dehydro-3-deoxyphosphooctonate aldolase [Flavobacterium ichthyis]NBL64112.1 2-dehydro-3-deoxyphosphooctonate aldolase [Flavobacterium ichthyis]